MTWTWPRVGSSEKASVSLLARWRSAGREGKRRDGSTRSVPNGTAALADEPGDLTAPAARLGGRAQPGCVSPLEDRGLVVSQRLCEDFRLASWPEGGLRAR